MEFRAEKMGVFTGEQVARDVENIFWAEYGVTKYAEIVAAREAGKKILGAWGDIVYPDALFSEGSCSFYLGNHTLARKRIGVTSDNVWTYNTIADTVVEYSQQYLTSAQKAMARSNIGAAPQSDVDGKIARPNSLVVGGFLVFDGTDWVCMSMEEWKMRFEYMSNQ